MPVDSFRATKPAIDTPVDSGWSLTAVWMTMSCSLALFLQKLSVIEVPESMQHHGSLSFVGTYSPRHQIYMDDVRYQALGWFAEGVV